MKNDPTESYLSLFKQVSQILKNKRHVLLHNKRLKSGVFNKKHDNEMNNSRIPSMNKIKSESTKELYT